MPKALTADEAASEAFDTAPVGSGPYKLDSASAESGLKLSKNESYNGPLPAKAETMTWNTNTDAAARIADLEGGRVQAIEAVPYLNVDSLKGSYEVEAKQAFNQAFLMFNNSAAPFDDKRVRQALHYAIDKDKVIQTALSGYGTPASSYLDEGNPDYQEASTVYDYDAAKAEQLLADAGVKDLSFELVTTDASFIKDIAPLVIEAWKAIGVKATLNTVPSAAVYGELGATSRTCRVRGPWTPSTRSSSMSLVAEGPLIHVRGRPAATASRSGAMDSGTSPTSCDSCTTQMCRSGTRDRARRPWSGPWSSTMVPVTAIPTLAAVTTASNRSSSSALRCPSSATTSTPSRTASHSVGNPGGTTIRVARESAWATAAAMPSGATRSTTAR